LEEYKIIQSPKVIWLYGLSGAGKSTIAEGIILKLMSEKLLVQHLDGDKLRKGINNNLGFSEFDRNENLRRSAEVAKLFFEAGFICLCSFITPTEQARNFIKEIIGKNNILEVFVKASIDICMKRDPKGLYQKVINGEIKNFTGFDSHFEIPVNPDIIIDTEKLSIEESIDMLFNQIKKSTKSKVSSLIN
jgi:adenylylsulfate kinase